MRQQGGAGHAIALFLAGAGLLTKCLNPKCSAQFRYLHEGKLFCMANNGAQGQRKTNGGHSELEYVWMCQACSLVFEPMRDSEGEIVVKPLMRTIAERRTIAREVQND